MIVILFGLGFLNIIPLGFLKGVQKAHKANSVLSAFIFGISMALLYLRTDNVFDVIFAHFINNLLAETIVFLDVNNVLFIDVVVFDLMSVLACVSFILILVWIVKQLNIIND